MAWHFLEVSKYRLESSKIWSGFKEAIRESNRNLIYYSTEVERTIIDIYPLFGIRASRKDEEINKLLQEYFTAAQHHIFIK